MNTVLETLKKAREIVSERWRQGDFTDFASLGVAGTPMVELCFCSLGAIAYAAAPGTLEENPDFDDVLDHDKDASGALTLLILANNTLFQTPAELVEWNDELGRSQEEVVSAFDRALALTQTP